MDGTRLAHLLDSSSHLIPSDEEVKRLFHASQIKAESLWLCMETANFTSTSIVNEQQLEGSLSTAMEKRMIIFLLQQQDTWGRIQITYKGFKSLICNLNCFPSFWTLVQGFGLKFEPRNENHVEYKSDFSPRTILELKKVEICYNIRYFDLHHRPHTKALWSERQVAVFQCFNIVNKSSMWVIIQASARIKSRLKDFLTALSETKSAASDHMNLHLLFFLELAGNWRSYINFLEVQLMEMDEKALHSKVGSICKSDYNVSFSDTQKLELIRRKLVKAALVLKSNADVGTSWRKDMIELEKQRLELELQDTFRVIQQYVTDLERHLRVVQSLLERLSGTEKLLFQMLEYRHDELKIQTNKFIQSNGEQLRGITEHAVAGNDFMTRLTADIHKDSKFIKMITFIALLYAPASLIATILSSNLVQVLTGIEERKNSRIVLVSDFWKFPLVAVSLLCVTVLPVLPWRKMRSMYERANYSL